MDKQLDYDYTPRSFEDPRKTSTQAAAVNMDEAAATLYKLKLIEAFCLDEISSEEVARIFDQTPVLRSA